MFEAIKKIKSWDDFLEATKLSNLIHKKVEEEKEEKKTKKVIITILAIIGAVAAVAAIAYFVYRYLTPDYLEDFDDDLDDSLMMKMQQLLLLQLKQRKINPKQRTDKVSPEAIRGFRFEWSLHEKRRCG